MESVIKLLLFYLQCVLMYATVLDYFSNTADFFHISPGVKQGEPLSPILFILFVNNMQNEISENINAMRILNEILIFMLMYADDRDLFANSEMEVQKVLDNLSDYCSE